MFLSSGSIDRKKIFVGSGLIDEEERRKNIISYNTKICTKFMIGEEKPYFEHNDRFAFCYIIFMGLNFYYIYF